LESRELTTQGEKELQRIRGAKMSLVFQEPGLALNPVFRAGEQVADVLRAHAQGDARECREKAAAALALVFGKEAPRIYSAFPHELSGGQRQRVVIAQALACGPALLIADEPTASLDTTVQAEILALLRDLQKRLQLSLLFITHNLVLLPGLVQRVLVMYAGQIVEDSPLDQLLHNPLHPYTAALRKCGPQAMKDGRLGSATALPVIPGSAPDLSELPAGCAFEPRCPDRMDVCRMRDPRPVELASARVVKCFKHGGEP
jgi:oligopeptide/dipeptide ABC transporter ATP-binding protein